MTIVATDPIVREIQIAASRETVFGFFTEPEKMTRWLCEAATSDPRPGGVLAQTHRSLKTGDLYHSRGEFLEIDYPSRVSFTWGWEEEDQATPIGSSVVEVTLEESDGGTLVRLVHSGLSEQPRTDHDAGWAMLLDELAKAVSA